MFYRPLGVFVHTNIRVHRILSLDRRLRISPHTNYQRDEEPVRSFVPHWNRQNAIAQSPTHTKSRVECFRFQVTYDSFVLSRLTVITVDS